MQKIFFKVPTKEDLKYRKMWLNDPMTMSYNAGLDLELQGYDKNTGTISKTDEE